MELITMDHKIELLKLAELRAERLRDLQRYATPNAPAPIDTLAIYDEYLKHLTGVDAATNATEQGGMKRVPNSIQAELEQIRHDLERWCDGMTAKMDRFGEGLHGVLAFLQTQIGARKEAFGLREQGATPFLRGIQLPDSPSPLPDSPPPPTANDGTRKE